MSSFSFKTLYALALAYLLIAVEGAPIEDVNKRSPQVLKLDFTVKLTDLNTTSINKREGGLVSDVLKHGQASYFSDIYVGSNKQKSTVIVDTGSSDLWIDDTSVTGGNYNPSSSSSYKFLSSSFRDDYGTSTSHTYAHGNWVEDSVALTSNGPSVNLQFGDVTNSNIRGTQGILGIGYTSLEGAMFEYPNYPQALADAGIINKNAYSLYLNSADAKTGSLLFGGIDHAKYDGQLVSFPAVGESLRLNVELNSASFKGHTYNLGVAANLDSGTTYSLLPPDFASAFSKAALGNNLQEVDGIYYRSGACPSSGPDLTFNFNGLSISIPISDYLAYQEGANACLSTITGSNEVVILGDNFLRHVYAVYDLQDHQISLAKVKYTTDSNISVIN